MDIYVLNIHIHLFLYTNHEYFTHRYPQIRYLQNLKVFEHAKYYMDIYVLNIYIIYRYLSGYYCL